jgi:hypothetical protein
MILLKVCRLVCIYGLPRILTTIRFVPDSPSAIPFESQDGIVSEGPCTYDQASRFPFAPFTFPFTKHLHLFIRFGYVKQDVYLNTGPNRPVRVTTEISDLPQAAWPRSGALAVLPYLRASSRSITDGSSLINIVVRCGKASVGTECAVTRAGYKRPKIGKRRELAER